MKNNLKKIIKYSEDKVLLYSVDKTVVKHLRTLKKGYKIQGRLRDTGCFKTQEGGVQKNGRVTDNKNDIFTVNNRY